MLWNSMGMFQQLILFTLLLVVYVAISLIIARSTIAHPGLESWMSNLHLLFVPDSILKDVLFGVLLGILAVLLTTLLDTLVAFMHKEKLSEWMHRSDYLLPQTRVQKRWAWGISITGSVLEEILFRGFILLAILPLWSHWIWAALILSAVFALLHANAQNFWSTIWIYLISILLCAIIALGGSIYLAVVTHVTINVLNLFFIPAVMNRKVK